MCQCPLWATSLFYQGKIEFYRGLFLSVNALFGQLPAQLPTEAVPLQPVPFRWDLSHA